MPNHLFQINRLKTISKKLSFMSPSVSVYRGLRISIYPQAAIQSTPIFRPAGVAVLTAVTDAIFIYSVL